MSLDAGAAGDDARAQEPVDPAPDPRQSAIEEDDDVVLEEALFSMDLPDRLIILDHVMYKLTYERIAEKRGLTLN
jgi:DNA-directed RNA polymerase specialized sigma24 family protein